MLSARSAFDFPGELLAANGVCWWMTILPPIIDVIDECEQGTGLKRERWHWCRTARMIPSVLMLISAGEALIDFAS